MNTEHLDDELLQQHFDGELAPAEESAARAHLAECAACRKRHMALERLRQLLQVSAEDAAQQVDWQGVYARIERAASTPEPVPVPAPAAAHRGAPTPTPIRRRMGPATASALGALAIAAAALLMVYRSEPEGSDAAGEAAGEELAALSRSEIVEIDFGSNAGTVFDIALSDGSSTPVVWINDDDDEEE